MHKYHFVARNCIKIQEQDLDEHEFIQVIEMPLADFKQHVRTGNMTDIAGAYIGMEKLQLL